MEEKLTAFKAALIKRAKREYEGYSIMPCGSKKTLEESFTCKGDTIIFWFNTSKDSSTRIMKATLN